MKQEAKDRLIFALDVDSLDEAKSWVERLQGKVGVFKVGKQLFTRTGPDVVRMIRDAGGEVFLDLKFHDIPNTVAMAGVEACRLGVRMFNVHALGGREMMAATVAAVDRLFPRGSVGRPMLLAVTILTSSTGETLREIGIERPVAEMVPRLARLAQSAGIDGVVASPREAELIRSACGENFAIVTPGVRPADADLNDQKRVATPGEAIAAGASYLVIGRPIAAAADPQVAAERIIEEIGTALAQKG